MQRVLFEIAADFYYVNLNTPNVSYSFYDFDSNETDAYNAKIFTVVAA
jgi:hypothetical protein